MKKGFLFFILITFAPIDFADLPVIYLPEIAQLAQHLHQLQQQYALLQETYKNAQQQLDEAKALRADEEGHYGFGNLLNSDSDLKTREWSPDSWDDTLKGLSGGNPARYQQLLTEYKQNHPTVSQSEYEKSTSKEQGKEYAQQIQVNRAASVNATYEFNDINNHLKTIHDLSGKIEKAKDEKAATDLNSRLIAEVAYIQTQELKMQVLLNQQLAQQAADDIAEKTQAAKFNRLPEE